MSTESSYDAAPLDDDLLRRRLDGLSRLLEVTKTLAGEIDAGKVLSTIVIDIAKAMECDRAGIYLYDEKRRELYPGVAAGAPRLTELAEDDALDESVAVDKSADSSSVDLDVAIEDVIDERDAIYGASLSTLGEMSATSAIGPLRRRIALGEGVTGYVAEHRRLCNVADPANDPRWSAFASTWPEGDVRNLLATPLLSAGDGALLGVLELVNKRGGEFDVADEELIVAFSQHAAIALDRARMVEQLKSRQEVETALSVARRIQRGYMPTKMPPMPGYDAAVWWMPHQAVGGDYCDVFSMGPGRLGLVVADVAGHGIGPGLIMASVRAALRALVQEHSSCQVLLELVNQSLAEDLRAGGFVTAALVGLDLTAHRFEFANAGHYPAIHYSAASDTFTDLHATGLPLGVLEDSKYPLGRPMAMRPGDWLLLGTDGLIEATDVHGQAFGSDRLKNVLRDRAASPAKAVANEIGRLVSAHFPGDSPEDDLTLLVLKRV